MTTTARRLVRGAAAGAGATAAMSAVMLAFRAVGATDRVAPGVITAAGEAVVGAGVQGPAHHAPPTVSHPAYGTAAGAVFNVVAPRRPAARLVAALAYATGLLVAS